ncbi:FI21212p1 [Strongyloides ratti]|uniref:FI21212p1 n=1 Tax=Strongyloides ratti TaxID=34506 RepID=A0A090L4Q0_STRRB|nr:FI21212p1 [Strongyloides ratti]CEF62484.1 FI21212p1 [Strongyloides ratti]
MYQLFIVLIIICQLYICNTFDNFDLFSILSQRDPNIIYHSPISLKLVNEYLQNFGYINLTKINDTDILNPMPNNILSESIKEFQRFSGLAETGILDDETRLKMGEPRCGMSDIESEDKNDVKKRSTKRWTKSSISYTISKFSQKIDSSDSKNGLYEAFGLWSAVVPLKFYETLYGGDIDIRFETGKHNDPWPFDGSGGTLAHATLGQGGFLHFDDSENWKYVKENDKLEENEIDYLNIATHEIGHALGLKHSGDPNSIMTPFYRRNVDKNGNYIKPKLSSSDIQNIQRMYGGSLNQDNTLFYLFNEFSTNFFNNNPPTQYNPYYNQDRYKNENYIPSYFFYFPFFG